MRESGFLGLMQVIFSCVRDAFGVTRAWVVMLVFALIFAIPVAVIALSGGADPSGRMARTSRRPCRDQTDPT